ncbi:hypothetical protein NG798_20890 [Ancylothrix sp. C2]|uniref:hypothetical protein n=1 Tax=Ancylothrix sp. D3o TaxID=2953691 RepID=UPI0021BB20EB|nr:hypothetical protein [Ancylothrix sp. D3o]MCT7952257.1 hypothetical protein [Ancylothrix sp. D3o]
MSNNQTAINRVDTLIITVGTRQVGWLCNDGIIRSFGADGNIGYPRHVEELYQQLELKRGFYQEKEKTYPHSARDLGERFYNHCIYELGYDFSRVQLLLDFHIIKAAEKNGLKHIILWGTDQPEKVSWSYRRLDTLWLAKLMEGKIKSVWKNLRVDVHTPPIEANDNMAIREELEELILKEALEFSSPAGIDNEFVLWIQNKGCTPAIASGVEICAAALGRQCKVFNACPDDPESFFEPDSSGFQKAVASTGYKLISMGEYFWPLERVRVISAWKRGDFSEVQIWLKPHETRYPVLYKLAGYLSRSANWETSNSLTKIGDWINSKDVLKLAGEAQVTTWKQRLEIVKQEPIAQAWESSFLIDLPLKRENYTAAFIQFVQTLERLLFLQFQAGNWLKAGYITIPANLQHLGNDYQPGFTGLIEGWRNSKKLNASDNWYKLLHRIREKRNNVIHSAESVTLPNIRSMWTDGGLFTVGYSEDPQVVKNLMLDVLKKISPSSKVPDILLLHSLYEWGLKTLCEEAGSSHK